MTRVILVDQAVTDIVTCACSLNESGGLQDADLGRSAEDCLQIAMQLKEFSKASPFALKAVALADQESTVSQADELRWHALALYARMQAASWGRFNKSVDGRFGDADWLRQLSETFRSLPPQYARAAAYYLIYLRVFSHAIERLRPTLDVTLKFFLLTAANASGLRLRGSFFTDPNVSLEQVARTLVDERAARAVLSEICRAAYEVAPDVISLRLLGKLPEGYRAAILEEHDARQDSDRSWEDIKQRVGAAPGIPQAVDILLAEARGRKANEGKMPAQWASDEWVEVLDIFRAIVVEKTSTRPELDQTRFPKLVDALAEGRFPAVGDINYHLEKARDALGQLAALVNPTASQELEALEKAADSLGAAMSIAWGAGNADGFYRHALSWLRTRARLEFRRGTLGAASSFQESQNWWLELWRLAETHAPAGFFQRDFDAHMKWCILAFVRPAMLGDPMAGRLQELVTYLATVKEEARACERLTGFVSWLREECPRVFAALQEAARSRWHLPDVARDLLTGGANVE
jgi:hypothetical protein